MKVIGIIPARWASSRFPGKPLADICGRSMIERVYRRAVSVIDDVVVATDDIRVYDEISRFGGRAVMTSTEIQSGTIRVYEAYKALKSDADIVVNIQGDEPFVAPQQLKTLIEQFESPDVEITTLARRFNPEEGWEALFNPNSPKVVMDSRGYAMYFSRSIIPYVRGHNWQQWIYSAEFFMHVGLYAYRVETLSRIVNKPVSPAAEAESLEQLTWLQAGIPVKVVVSDYKTIGVDTPDDLIKAIEYSKKYD